MNTTNTELVRFLKQLETSSPKRLDSYDYETFLSDHFTIVNALEYGVNTKLFKEIKDFCVLNDHQWANVLDISLATLKRYMKRESHIFKINQTQKIFQVMNINIVGQNVFCDYLNFKIWLEESTLIFDGKSPVELLNSTFGQQLVLEELNNIEHGIFL